MDEDPFGDIIEEEFSMNAPVHHAWVNPFHHDDNEGFSFLMTHKEPVVALGGFLHRGDVEQEDEEEEEHEEEEEEEHVVLTPVVVKKSTAKRKTLARPAPPPPPPKRNLNNSEGEKRMLNEIQRLADLVAHQQTLIDLLMAKVDQPVITLNIPLSAQQKINECKEKPFPKLISIPTRK